jgi:hypothetical protein
MLSSVLRMSNGSKRKSKPRLIVALRIVRGVKLKTSSLSRVHLALIFIREKLVRSISPNSQRRLQCPLGISRNSQCMIENIFPRALSGVFSQAWNIKSSTKTWNRPKFSTRVTSMVYCSMLITYYEFPVNWEENLKSGPDRKFFWVQMSSFHREHCSKSKQSKTFVANLISKSGFPP